ncbi:hypothetical protein RD792_012990 [Penstemon davidsonii]|uniref:Uncharacterized protein n=1 Tax=Penstemon davidsonii TaxID=160366 RepID=A0ABR0CTQ4_9LAMI|nr:hypothetical protein RD792_012990 [Penstemon davidsonii]
MFSTRVTPTTYETVDSLFIVDSLLDDLENLMNHPVELDIIMKSHMEILREELTLSRSFTKDCSMFQNTGVIDESEESLVQIRDVTYEAEYLINSHVVGNLPVWYLKLRLPDVIKKIKLVGTKLKKFISKIHDINVMERFSGEVSGITTSRLDNFIVDFDDERNRILEDLMGG